MSDEMSGVLVEKYSANEDFMYEITKNSMGQFDLWVFGYDERLKGYFMMEEHRQLADRLEAATALGDGLLVTLEQ